MDIAMAGSDVRFQMALKPHQLFDKIKTKHQHSHHLHHSLNDSHAGSEETVQSIVEHKSIWKVIEWHFQWLKKVNSKDEQMLRCVDIGAKVGFYSLLMAQYDCKVDVFEPQQSLVESLKVSVSLNNLTDRIVIHRTAVADGKVTNTREVELMEGRPLPTADDCLFQENAGKKFAMIRIDNDGLELHSLQGLKATIENGLVEAILLMFCPSCWERIGLLSCEGFKMFERLFADHYSLSILVRTEWCPDELFAESSTVGALVDKNTSLKSTTFKVLREMLEIFKTKQYKCNIFLLHKGHSLDKRLEIVSFSKSW
jgi:FkbM family methyltransferase